MMYRRGFAAVVVALGAAAVFLFLKHGPTQDPGDRFVELAPGVLRQAYKWHKQPGITFDVHSFLVRVKGPGRPSYILVDAGAPIAEQDAFLLKALDVATADGSLALILLTHGHSDHVGALRAVARKYDSVQIAFHEAEADFLLREVSYNSLPGAPGAVTDYSVLDVLPNDRVLLIKGSTGDVADAQGLTAEPPKWLPPRGLLSYQLYPGHTPGQVAFLHAPSRSLILGDAIRNSYGLDLPFAQFTPNMTQARESAMQLRTVDYSMGFPSHDEERGLTKRRIDGLLNRLSTDGVTPEA